MEITGKLKAILPMQTGEGKNGQWKKCEFVIETDGQYPKQICFALFKDKVELIERRQLGDVLTVKFDAESREYQGRYFTNLNAYSVSRSGGSGQAGNSTSSTPPIDPLDSVLGPLDDDSPAPADTSNPHRNTTESEGEPLPF